MKSNLVAIIQARTNSTRLPRKVLKDLGGRTLIEFLIERLKNVKELDQIVLATTSDEIDDKLVNLVRSLGLKVIRGSTNDVLSRYLKAAKETSATDILRITGDCPLIDPDLISLIINKYNKNNFDYFSNTDPCSFPDGLDAEIFKFELLLEADKSCKDRSEREHVTQWMRENKKIKKGSYKHNIDYSNLRWTVDEGEDLEVIRDIVENFNNTSSFSWEDVIRLYKENPSMFNKNSKFHRNQGKLISSGQKLWRRAKKVIPGGNMLLSKRAELFLPELWPSYFSKAKGCSVWDLDNNKFTDMSIMGIGTNILGYGHPEVDKAVNKVIKAGNMSTLNCPEEVLLAEKLIELHPWFDMVRFARSGGEANAIAIRIARAATGRETIAICGYHGWHDWYLATNLNKENDLEEHLLPGLEPNGVPSGLKDTVKPFSYNRFDQIEKIAKDNKLAAIKMEVQRSEPPKDGFLEKIKNLCKEKGIILIFDECTSGFRETNGGLHKKYNVMPDMTMFGKALGNGYAITAVAGTREVMESAQSTFISSTFWTERIGPAAALKTLEIMESLESWQKITKNGLYLRSKWQELADNYGLKIKHIGLPSLTAFVFQSERHMEYKTFITQEMLKKGYLAANSCYVSISHSKKIIDRYVDSLDDIFAKIANFEQNPDFSIPLEGPVCHSGFKRLN